MIAEILQRQDLDNGSFDIGGEIIFEGDKYTFTCDDEGENAVTVTVTDECGNTSQALAYVIVEAVQFSSQNENQITKDWEIDVNINQFEEGATNIQIENISKDENIDLSIYSFDGQLIHNTRIKNNSSWRNEIALPTGTYFFIIESQTGQKITRKQFVF